jgi:hypothetical protein
MSVMAQSGEKYEKTNPLVAGEVIITTQVHVQGYAVGDIVYDQLEASQLIPYPGEEKWHHDIFDRCCSCGGDCWLAWCCPCVTLAHIVSKLNALGSNYCLSFNVIIIVLVSKNYQKINISHSPKK